MPLRGTLQLQEGVRRSRLEIQNCDSCRLQKPAFTMMDIVGGCSTTYPTCLIEAGEGGGGSPMTLQPSRAAFASVFCMAWQLCTGRNSRAPLLALLTAGVRGALLREQVSTPVAPRKCTDRRMAPRFCCDRHRR